MRDGFWIIDADRHVSEPMALWEAYLPPAFKHRAPTLEFPAPAEPLAERLARLGPRGLVPPQPHLMLEGQPAMHKLSERAQIELALSRQRRAGQMEAGAAPEAQLASMDATGVDVALLFPTFTTYLLGVDTLDPQLASALAGAYNAWLRDFCRADPARLRGVGLVNLHDPVQMVPDLMRFLDLGWRAVVLRPNPVKGRLLGDPAYEPFWAACAAHGVGVALHEGTHTHLPTAGADRFETRFALHACSHPMEQMMGLLALIEGGVLERHPTLRVGLLEAGCGWLPYWLYRLDEVEYRHLAGEVEAHVKQPPSAYFQRQCFASIDPGEPLLTETIRHLGADRFLFGTDFPHLDHDIDCVGNALSLRATIGDEALAKILSGNAARLFGLSVPPRE
ncbi:amidohydrolase family protein [Chondromyces crocatus]|uniref:Amidohydrolase-related domain-containing protein n=1 Tax=Chondromyces crocatus TaxID=52 RepID=A0A0K1ESV0_CHOCO|nr:amidohydrolase family protein [Chondromyces crocatus]AKT43941.1 uncharacterized protein CMC5_081780 [Chondromyces crocatus]